MEHIEWVKSLHIKIVIMFAAFLLHCPTNQLFCTVVVFFACLVAFVFYVVWFRDELNIRLCCNKEVWFFTPLHRIWAFASFEYFLKTLWSNLCCLRGHRVSDQWISGEQKGFLRELLLAWVDELNRWMDRLLEEWADQCLGALFEWCRNYIIG